MRGIWWIKRDFRLFDNECLHVSLLECNSVLPFFCWETAVLKGSDFSKFHLQAQWHALAALRKELENRNGGIWETYGEIIQALEALHLLFPFNKIYSHQETGNLITFARDRKVAKWCAIKGISWLEPNASSVVRGGNAVSRRVALSISDYRKQGVLPVPNCLKFPAGFKFPRKSFSWRNLTNKMTKFKGSILSKDLQVVEEREAWNTLDSFLKKRARGYSGGISSPNSAFIHGSRLSPHLAWGTISLRAIFTELEKRINQVKEDRGERGWTRSLRAFQSRLFWRDHFIQRLESFPQLEEKPLNRAYGNLEYQDCDQKLSAWLNGKTGFPMVDACMRCLAETGFLNFRMRAMLVSFACFGLHLSWKKIHPELACRFLDYEPGIHLPQIQMQAGIIGINAIRVYSPSKQFIDQDPEATFVKRWIPELREYRSAEIANMESFISRDYAAPIINLRKESSLMKKRIFSIRRSMEGKLETAETLRKHGSKKKPSNKTRERSGQLFLF